MNRLLKLIVLVLLLSTGISPIYAKKSKTEVLEDSVTSLAHRINSISLNNRRLSASVDSINVAIIEKNEDIQGLKALITEYEAKAAGTAPEVVRNEAQLSMVKKEIKDNNIFFVEMASNFLYLPYNRESIEMIAIPAFNQAKGSSFYDDYKIRYHLLRNYSKDIKELQYFLNDCISDLKKFNSKDSDYDPFYSVYGDSDSPETPASLAKQFNNRFLKLRCVSDYKEYGKGWEETFLGKLIYRIEKALSDESIIGRPAKMEDIFSNYLTKLQY